MTAVRQLLLFAFAGGALVASAGELAVAREALRDGLWSIARKHAAAVIGSAEAKLVVLESLAGEGKWKEVAGKLEEWDGEKGDAFEYYRAVVSGNHKRAVELLKAGGSADGLAEAQLYEAQELLRVNRRADAVRIWLDLASRTNVSERVLVIASSNAMDPTALSNAFARVRSAGGRRQVGLRLGIVQCRSQATMAAGERLIRSIVRDSPDEPGAREAFLAIADALVGRKDWQRVIDTYHEASEIWPDTAKMASVQENRGWALQALGRRDEALEAYKAAVPLAGDDDAKASALLKAGDLLSEMGRGADAMGCYREILSKYPKTMLAEKLKVIVRLREMEEEGRRLYADGRYSSAMKLFDRVAESDSSRRQRLAYFSLLCLYGQGLEDQAERKARELVDRCPDPAVRADAVLWLAKYLYNRHDWTEAIRLFVAYADLAKAENSGTEALLWASRAALADNDFAQAIKLTTMLLERNPAAACRPQALLVQGEALVELARFDEAILVFERVMIAQDVPSELKLKAQILRADALFVMGADNPSRYEAALEGYRAAQQGLSASHGSRFVLSFKIARTLEKLKRMEEAMDIYYTEVVLAYRSSRLRGERPDDEAAAVFSRAAFRLADEYEGRGRDRQAGNVLQLVVESDVPAAGEAAKRIRRLTQKGAF